MSTSHDKPFRFKQFEVVQTNSAMKVGTDGVLLGAWVRVDNAQHILDVGAGTGVIALICAQRNTSAFIEAVEIDEGSAEDAQYNFDQSPWKDRMRMHFGNFLKVSSSQKFDLIISNPPYFSQSLKSNDPSRNAARHDDSLPAELFVYHAKRMLNPNGRLALIFPKDQLNRWVEQAEKNHLFLARICHVYTLATKEASRVMVEFCFGEKTETVMESLLIEKSPGLYSEAYKQLTRELYTKW
ncbi:MAG: tRNA1(Val) (adenine(37)-N6)-methyltransferase [Flavobacteriales bacterium]|jgi:tRNA1Val (adenine37-N6)-methyltransferase